jgi:hypothetical protein
MKSMRSLGLTVLGATLATGACVPGSKSLGEGETAADDGSGGETAGESESGQQSGSASASGTTTGAASGSTTGNTTAVSDSESASSDGSGSTGVQTCNDEPPPVCGPCPSDCEGWTECTDFGWECGCDCPGDTDGAICELEPIVVDATLNTKALPEDVIDCGYLTLGDTMQDWQAGHDCAVDADLMGQTYRLLWDMQGIDSFPSAAIAGLQGFAFQRVFYNEDKGGIAFARTVVTRQCSAFDDPPNCTVSPGQMCFTCADAGSVTTVCEAPQ